MKDLIITSAKGYAPSQVACWINSILHTGFDGDIVVISFGLPEETIRFLEHRGVKIIHTEPQGRHIVVERFAAMYQFLNSEKQYRYIIATDIRDVVFQKDPIEFVSSDPAIMVASENILYKDEDWGDNNLKTSYPHLYEQNKDHIIYNAGVIAGICGPLKDFFLHIYHLSLIGGDAQPDQAAMNILIHTWPFSHLVYKVDQIEAFVMNHGTDLDKYEDKLIDHSPIITKDGTVLDYHTEESFGIIHQYDRVPGLKELIEEKFGSIK